MKIMVIGSTGTIGQAVIKELATRHEIVAVANKHGDLRVDISDRQSIQRLYQTVGKVDAVVVCTGKVHFGELSQMTMEQYQIGLNNKLMGQVNLVLEGLAHVNEQGSFTLTSGILNHDPIRYGSSAAMVNGAVEGFIKAAALEMPKGIRINVVSPTVLAESMQKLANYFRGYLPVSAADVALAYAKSVEGAQTGQVYRVGYSA